MTLIGIIINLIHLNEFFLLYHNTIFNNLRQKRVKIDKSEPIEFMYRVRENTKNKSKTSRPIHHFAKIYNKYATLPMWKNRRCTVDGRI